MMAKVLLAEAIVGHISMTPEFDKPSIKEIKMLIKTVQEATKSEKEVRRLFFVQSNLGAYLSKRKQTQLAVESYQSALDIAKTFASTHPDSLVTALSNLGFLTKRAEKPKQAQALFDEAFEHSQRLIEKQPDAHSLWLKTYYRALSFGTLAAQTKIQKSLRLSASTHEQKLSEVERKSMQSTLEKLKRRGAL